MPPPSLVRMDAMRASNERALYDLLDSYDGTKAIVWQAELMKPFGLVSGAKELQRRHVLHMYRLEAGMSVPQCAVDHVLFVVRPSAGSGQLLADAVHKQLVQRERAGGGASAQAEGEPPARLHLVLVPAADAVFEQLIGEAAHGRVLAAFKTTCDLALRVLPLDADIATLDMDAIVRSLLVYNDWSVLHAVATAVIQLQRVFGPAAVHHYKGDWAKWVHRLVQMDERRGSDAYCGVQRGVAEATSGVQHLFIMDRMVDPVTPLLTQLTYEGLIDEFYNINYGSIKLPSPVSSGSEPSASSAAAEKKSLALDSNDELYGELRDLCFSAVASHLSKRIKSLAQFEDSRHSATSVREMADFVRRLPAHAAAKASASQHTNIVESLRLFVHTRRFVDTLQCERDILHAVDTERTLAHIDNEAVRAAPHLQVLRLMCLQSLICDGLKPKVLDAYRSKFVQGYGYEHVDTLVNLQRAGVLRERAAPPKSLPFSYPSLNGSAKKGDNATHGHGVGQVKRQLRLLVDGVDEQKRVDSAYAYSGWAPVVSRALEALATGWSQPHVLDAFNALPGAMEVNIVNNDSAGAVPTNEAIGGEHKPTVVLVLIGGVTCAELSALRLVAKQRNLNLLIVTTSVINGTKFLKHFHTLPSHGDAA